MKKFILFFATLYTLSAGVLSAQDDWLYKVSYELTDNCVDSVTCYSAVSMKVNLTSVLDSAALLITIGDSIGGDNIYSRQFIKDATLMNLPEVSTDEEGYPVFSLGDYLETSFYVDLQILDPEFTRE